MKIDKKSLHRVSQTVLYSLCMMLMTSCSAMEMQDWGHEHPILMVLAALAIAAIAIGAVIGVVALVIGSAVAAIFLVLTFFLPFNLDD